MPDDEGVDVRKVGLPEGIEVNVGAAHAAISHFHLYISGLHLRHGGVHNFDLPVLHDDRCFVDHSIFPSFIIYFKYNNKLLNTLL